jgi:hypothetical protein
MKWGFEDRVRNQLEQGVAMHAGPFVPARILTQNSLIWESYEPT